jgi:hypothetical protein
MLTLCDFTQHDWDAWAGCETHNPKLCYFGTGYCLIVDGPYVDLYNYVEGEKCSDGDNVNYTDTQYYQRNEFGTHERALKVGQALLDAYEVLKFELWETIVDAALSPPESV